MKPFRTIGKDIKNIFLSAIIEAEKRTKGKFKWIISPLYQYT